MNKKLKLIILRNIHSNNKKHSSSMNHTNENINTQNENEIYYPGNLDLSLVNWKPNYILSMASIGQIMKSFSNIKNLNAKNTYEKVLYDKLASIIKILLDKYNNILNHKNKIERDVKYFNLIVNLPKNTIVGDDTDNIKLKNARIGKLIEASKQRIKFIMEREIPIRYKENIEYENAFNNLREELKDFMKALSDFEKDFILAIDSSKKAQVEKIRKTLSN